MRLRLFALLVSVFSCLPIAAQEYYIDLSKKEFSIAQRNFYISRIIDARANKQSIGFVQRYINNQRVYASFKNGLTKDIQDFMLRNMHQQQNLYPVAMKI
nr:hypothetical protein [Cytophagales bacterium]